MNTAVKENVVAVIPPRRKPAEPAAPAAEEKVLEAGSKDITGKVESIIIETEDDYGEAAEYEAVHDEEHHAERDPRAAADHKERRRSSGQKRERHEEHEESVDRRHLALFHADILLHLVCHCCSFLSFTDVVSV